MTMVVALLVATALLVQQTATPKEELALGRLRAGQQLLQRESWEAAAKEFTAAIDLDPLLDLAYYGLGQAHMGAREYGDAIQAFKQCRDVYLRNETDRLADSIGAEHRLEERIQSLRDYRRSLESGQNATFNTSGTMNRIDGEIAQLETMRKRHLSGGAQVAPFILTELGSAYFRHGDLAQAEAEWRSALTVDSKLGEVHNNLAVVCLMTDRVAEAAEHVQRAEKAGVRVNPQLKADIEARRH
jgi:tetratricopeptide (TPR) repeat protein